MKAVIFDCDGTLVDTEVLCASTDVEIFAEAGIVYNDVQDFLAEFIGVANRKIVATLNARHGTNLSFDYFFEKYGRRIIPRIAKEMIFFPESVMLVKRLAERGVKMAVASNGKRDVVLEELRVAGYLDIIGLENIFAISDAPNPKPAPDLYLAAAQKLGADPGACLVVEDSAPGACGGIAAGMTVIGYNGLSHSPDEARKRLLNAGCVKIINTLSDIETLLS